MSTDPSPNRMPVISLAGSLAHWKPAAERACMTRCQGAGEPVGSDCKVGSRGVRVAQDSRVPSDGSQ